MEGEELVERQAGAIHELVACCIDMNFTLEANGNGRVTGQCELVVHCHNEFLHIILCCLISLHILVFSIPYISTVWVL